MIPGQMKIFDGQGQLASLRAHNMTSALLTHLLCLTSLAASFPLTLLLPNGWGKNRKSDWKRQKKKTEERRFSRCLRVSHHIQLIYMYMLFDRPWLCSYCSALYIVPYCYPPHSRCLHSQLILIIFKWWKLAYFCNAVYVLMPISYPSMPLASISIMSLSNYFSITILHRWSVFDWWISHAHFFYISRPSITDFCIENCCVDFVNISWLDKWMIPAHVSVSRRLNFSIWTKSVVFYFSILVIIIF